MKRSPSGELGGGPDRLSSPNAVTAYQPAGRGAPQARTAAKPLQKTRSGKAFDGAAGRCKNGRMGRTLVALGLVAFWFAACGGSSTSDQERGGGSGDAGSDSGDGGRTSGGSGGDRSGGASGDSSGGASGDAAGGASGDTSGGAAGAGASGGSGGAGASGGSVGTGATSGSSASAGSGPAELVACDVTEGEDACSNGVCAGTPSSGFYCRPPCPDDALVGDACGDSGICLEIRGYDSDVLACYELAGCNIQTSEGCDTSAGESCLVVDAARLATVCVAAGDLEAGDRCDGNAGAPCAPGLACLGSDIEDGDPGRCTPLCEPGAPLPSDCVECIAVTEDVGSCAECSVLEDDCDAGTEHCYPISELLGGVCVEFGPGAAGDECTFDPSASCQEGLLCMELEDVPGPDPMACVEMCDTATTECSLPGYYCNDIGLFDPAFGAGELALCIDSGVQFCWPSRGIQCRAGTDCILPGGEDEPGACVSACDPSDGNAACAANYACLPFVDDAFFVDAVLHGNGVCGPGCEGDGDCSVDGEVCLPLGGLEAAGVCTRHCETTDDAPCGDSDDVCIPYSATAFDGVCVPSGEVCDPTATADSCDPGLTCTTWTDSTTGLCLPGCHVQNPDACEAATCVEKTGERWQQGICLGSEVPCDPIAQTGCDAGETCRVLAGPGVGGHAFSCEEAGDVEEGGDCSGDDVACVEGLLCVGDVCYAPCDPEDPECAAGTCVDASDIYVLPAGSIGICTTD